MKELINIIKTGNRDEVKEAQKEIKKKWYNISYPLSKKQIKEYEVFIDEIRHFDEIENLDNQVYFINTLKWPFLVLGEEYFEFFAGFILKQIQHPSGKIRMAIIHAADWLFMSLTFDLSDLLDKKITDERKEIVRKNRERFGYFVLIVEQLLEKYYEPRFNRYKYVSSLPPGVYKSLQKLITENLLRSEYFEKIYADFLTDFLKERKPFQPMPDKLVESRKQILERRKEIEKKLSDILKETKSSFSLEDIKEIIYNEKGQDDLTKIIVMFNQSQSTAEMNKILEIINDAWNYFPHKCLNGLCPMEKLLEYRRDKK